MKYSILIILVSFLFFTCKKKETTASTANEPESAYRSLGSLPNDFLAFYQRFHRDSAYQVSHINFPLEGKSTVIDTSGNEKHSFIWNKDNWQLHQELDMLDTSFQRTYIADSNDRLITENIYHVNGTFAIQRRFYKTGADYSLIYYNVINNLDISNPVME